MGGNFWSHTATWTFLCCLVRMVDGDRGLLQDLGLDALPDVTKVCTQFRQVFPTPGNPKAADWNANRISIPKRVFMSSLPHTHNALSTFKIETGAFAAWVILRYYTHIISISSARLKLTSSSNFEHLITLRITNTCCSYGMFVRRSTSARPSTPTWWTLIFSNCKFPQMPIPFRSSSHSIQVGIKSFFSHHQSQS